MSHLVDQVTNAPRQAKKQKTVPVANMGKDPYQTIATRLHAIRQYMIDQNKKDGNIEIEAKFGYIVDKHYDGRMGPFLPGAGAVEILAADMQNKKFVSGTTKKDFETFRTVQEKNGSKVETSDTKAYSWGEGRRIQVESNGNVIRERKTRVLESQFHLPACPYDCRITVSIEEGISEKEAGTVTDDLKDDWESCRHKHRTSFVGAYLPNKTHSTWQADFTHVELTEGHSRDQVEHTYEVELEMSGDAVRAWFGAEDPQKETGKVAWDLWERVRAMMPREETCSSLREITDPAYTQLAVEACNLPWRDQQPSGAFPGTLPIGFGRRMIQKVQTQSYMVSEKTDGVRHFLAVVHPPGAEHLQAVLIDRKMRIFTMAGMESLGEVLGKGTLIDGEVVRNRSWKRDIFMCFDMMHDGENAWVEKLFPDRLLGLSKLLRQKYMTYLLPVNANDAMCPTMRTLPIVLKHFYPARLASEVVRHIHMEGADRVYLERQPDGSPARERKRHHKSDGLIFAPNRPYTQGTDFEYLKWKWHDMITLDFEVSWGGQYPHGMSVGFPGNGSELVDFTEHVSLPPLDLYRLRGDMATLKSMVGEFEFSPEEGLWLYKLPRPDKKKANYSRTVLSTLMELAEGMEIEEVVYRLSFSGGKGDDWEQALAGMRENLLKTRIHR